MPKNIYALSESDAATLREMAAAYRAGELGRPLPKPRRPLPRCDVIFGVVDSQILGTTGSVTTPGSGTLNVYTFTSTGGTSDTGRNETVYNATATNASTDEYTVCVRDYNTGHYLIVRENS